MRLGDPRENSRGAIDLTYTHDGSNVPLFLSASGRGFQQMLLILAYLYSHKGSVLLVDEPDAHLEILRQKQIFRLLRDIAGENRSQVVMVTHSEVIMNEALALETKLTVLGGGRTDNLSTKAAIVEALPTSKS
jgi:ABC-type cobalamin/Fe3+-siderophores transport system ATPase subunit